MIDQIIDQLVTFLHTLIPGIEIVRGQANRVPMPKGDYITLTEVDSRNLSVSDVVHRRVTEIADINNSRSIDIQIDIYSKDAGDYAATISSVILSDAAYGMFTGPAKPLCASNPTQSPLVAGEQQYIRRWILTITMQYHPVVTFAAQSANVVELSNVAAIDI